MKPARREVASARAENLKAGTTELMALPRPRRHKEA